MPRAVLCRNFELVDWLAAEVRASLLVPFRGLRGHRTSQSASCDQSAFKAGISLSRPWDTLSYLLARLASRVWLSQ